MDRERGKYRREERWSELASVGPVRTILRHLIGGIRTKEGYLFDEGRTWN